MCGIGALLDPTGSAPADAGRRMTAALHHRGPDGDGVRRIGPATLAHTRLAIIGVPRLITSSSVCERPSYSLFSTKTSAARMYSGILACGTLPRK